MTGSLWWDLVIGLVAASMLVWLALVVGLIVVRPRSCVGSHGLVIDPGVVAQLVSRRRPTDPSARSAEERDVLTLMAQGRSNAAISERLFLSPKTVETCIRSVFTKLDLHETIEDNRRVLAVLTYLGAANCSHADVVVSCRPMS